MTLQNALQNGVPERVLPNGTERQKSGVQTGIHLNAISKDIGAAPEGRPLDDSLRGLARRVDRLVPSRRDPEAYFIEKDTIAAELRRMAREAGR